jgi:hypothetical protein
LAAWTLIENRLSLSFYCSKRKKKKKKEISEKNISSQTSLRQPMDSEKTKKIYFVIKIFVRIN